MVLMFRLLSGWRMLKRSVCTRKEPKQQVRSNFLSLEITKPDIETKLFGKLPAKAFLD